MLCETWGRKTLHRKVPITTAEQKATPYLKMGRGQETATTSPGGLQMAAAVEEQGQSGEDQPGQHIHKDGKQSGK